MPENERVLLDFFHAAPIGLLWVSPTGKVERVNQAQLDLLARKGDVVIGRPLARLVAEPRTVSGLLQRIREHETLRDFRLKLLRPDGTVRHVLIDANGLWQGRRLVHSRWFVRDITRRVDLEREILATAERERERIGRELHDGLCQELIAIEFICENTARQWSADHPEVARRAREVAQALRRTIGHARDLARGLSPSAAIVGQHLQGALEDLAERTRSLFHRACTVEGRLNAPLADPAVGVHLYRIAQEAVSNAIRHGRATRLQLTFHAHGRDLYLKIRDNGCGFVPDRVTGAGMGLRIMQYRAAVINGTLAVERAPRRGMIVSCEVRQALAPAGAPTPA